MSQVTLIEVLKAYLDAFAKTAHYLTRIVIGLKRYIVRRIVIAAQYDFKYGF